MRLLTTRQQVLPQGMPETRGEAAGGDQARAHDDLLLVHPRRPFHFRRDQLPALVVGRTCLGRISRRLWFHISVQRREQLYW